MSFSDLKKFKHIDTRLVGILRTKPGTPAKNAIQAIRAAFDAGATAVEITSNSDHWQEIVSECVKKSFNIGVGSIKNKEFANEAVKLGAKFLVSPGTFPEVIEVAAKNKIPTLPGVYTETDFKKVVALGISDIKFFPASVRTHEELFKAIKEPFRDEFEELTNKGKEIIYFDPSKKINELVISSPTELYDYYKKASQQDLLDNVVIKLPNNVVGLDRLKEFSNQGKLNDIRTYAVGGVSDKNMKEVLCLYGAYGVCPGSGMFNNDAILNGDFERVRTDVRRHVVSLNEICSAMK